MTAPLFSIVTIAFNYRDGLARVADSVLDQTCADWEWIVVDGGSIDGSAALLQGIADPRLSWVSEPDRGIYDAMNKGLARAKGGYVVFMNAGDTFAGPDELARAANDVRDLPDLVYGDGIEVDGAEEHYKPARSHRRAWYSMFTHHQAIYYRRGLFEGRRFDETFLLAADWALTLDLLRDARHIKRVDRAVCRFERAGASFTKNRALADREAYRVYREHARLRWPVAQFVFRAKTTVNAIRFRFPWLYDRLRMRG